MHTEFINAHTLPRLLRRSPSRLDQTVSISITNGPGNAPDWIGLYAVGPSDFSCQLELHEQRQTAPAAGQTSGTVSPVPSAPGDYEFCFFSNLTWQRIAVSAVFTAVSPPHPELCVRVVLDRDFRWLPAWRFIQTSTPSRSRSPPPTSRSSWTRAATRFNT